MQASADTHLDFQWELHRGVSWDSCLVLTIKMKFPLENSHSSFLVTDLVMKIQPHRYNVLLFYYLKGRLNISILLIE